MGILRDIVGLHIWLKYSCAYVDVNVQEVNRFQVSTNVNSKPMLFKDFADFLLHNFGISGSERAHSQAIIPVQARVDVEVTELGEQEQTHKLTNLSRIKCTLCDIKLLILLFVPGFPFIDKIGFSNM